MKDGHDPIQRMLRKLYSDYEEDCQRNGVVDFAELLLRAYELWRDNASLLAHYRSRFTQVLVDEFQDTNSIQYAWTKLIAGPEGTPFVVGDDDQSIYRWRGAKVENLRQFTRDYPRRDSCSGWSRTTAPPATSSSAANALISHNTGRLGKNLWTSGGKGEPIRLFAAYNERDEADFVVSASRTGSRQGGARARSRDPVSLQRAVTRVRRSVPVRAHAVQGLWRPALLRARRDQGCARLPAADRQPR